MSYDYVLYLFPTSPLKNTEDIENSINLLIDKDVDIVISVCETEHPIYWANKLSESKSLKSFINKKYRRKNRQDLPKTYRINGSIYVGKWDVFYSKKDWFEIDSYAYIMPKNRSIDIDEHFDFKLAEVLIKEKYCE